MNYTKTPQSKTQISRFSKKIEEIFYNRKYFYGLGRRKSAVARVKFYPEGKSRCYINGRDFRQFFPFFEFQKIILSALDFLKLKQIADINVKVQGGGVRGQAEAIKLGIARALVKMDADNKIKLRRAGFLTRDSRVKERKKPGLKSARRAPQWQKR